MASHQRYPYSRIAEIVREAGSVADGVAPLRKLAQERVPASHAIWNVVDRMRFTDDVPAVRAALIERLEVCKPEANGIYFGWMD